MTDLNSQTKISPLEEEEKKGEDLRAALANDHQEEAEALAKLQELKDILANKNTLAKDRIPNPEELVEQGHPIIEVVKFGHQVKTFQLCQEVLGALHQKINFLPEVDKSFIDESYTRVNDKISNVLGYMWSLVKKHPLQLKGTSDRLFVMIEESFVRPPGFKFHYQDADFGGLAPDPGFREEGFQEIRDMKEWRDDTNRAWAQK